jgi:hypothetical protein
MDRTDHKHPAGPRIDTQAALNAIHLALHQLTAADRIAVLYCAANSYNFAGRRMTPTIKVSTTALRVLTLQNCKFGPAGRLRISPPWPPADPPNHADRPPSIDDPNPFGDDLI